MHESDDRLRTAPHAHDDFADAPLGIEAGGRTGRRSSLHVSPTPRFLEVQAGAKCTAGAPKDDQTNGAVKIKLAEIVEKLVHDFGVERIERIGTIEHEPVDRPFFLD